ncbi:hypothetical protein D1B31_08030 [Neobacillus notoginsengisoli]|uniref:Uncharacterized protein n=1 Tax=Neobacillus notoginsengisoli TaxID=1578198 RepID=A0A417YWC4_9BACI|nr:hypothetical protein [Neobacillus notoginsengisoli]RHW41655.1 hypothetical protein D1B31_08030 [Neobacillus notoginsengisoli]
MSKKHAMPNMYEVLRKAGFQLENQLNQSIHDHWNREEVAEAAAIFTNAHARLINKLHRYHEVLSTQLNTPTKKDVANVAKLVLQTEEKVDQLNDQMIRLTEKLEKQLPRNPRSASSFQKVHDTRAKRKEALRKLSKDLFDAGLIDRGESPVTDKVGTGHTSQVKNHRWRNEK